MNSRHVDWVFKSLEISRAYDVFFLCFARGVPTACVTGGWGEPTHETENCQSSEPAQKNAQSPSRPVHALLAHFLLSSGFSLEF
jgi:hypothetical protein